MDSARIYDKVNLVSSKNGYIMPRIKWSIKTIGLQFGNLGPFGSLLSLIPQGKHVAYVTLYHLTSVSRLSTTLGEFRRVLFGQMRSKCIIKKNRLKTTNWLEILQQGLHIIPLAKKLEPTQNV